MHPKVLAWTLVPLMVSALLTTLVGWLYWDSLVRWIQQSLDSWALLSTLWGWLESWGASGVRAAVAPLLVILVATPLIAITSLFIAAMLMTPALVRLVAQRRFPQLERKRGGSLAASLLWSLASTALALLALLVSTPLWLVPPLLLVLPPLIWGWLTYRVMVFDVLAEHASAHERRVLMRRYRPWLLGIGVITGYLGTAPSLLWASSVVFATAFFVLIPLALWIYTVIFAFSALWFTHYALAALERLRAESIPPRANSIENLPSEAASAVALPPTDKSL